MRVIFFVTMFKIESKFQKWRKKLGKLFCFWDNYIWKCCNTFSLLRREYLSSAVNVLTNRPNIFHITRDTFRNWLACTLTNKYRKGAAVQIWRAFRSVYHVTCRRVLSNWFFLDIYLTAFFGVPKFKNTSPMRIIFFLKIFKMESKFAKCKKKLRKDFLVLR